jgi:hypothetical protein
MTSLLHRTPCARRKNLTTGTDLLSFIESVAPFWHQQNTHWP